jgi:hypothetical protein
MGENDVTPESTAPGTKEIIRQSQAASKRNDVAAWMEMQ